MRRTFRIVEVRKGRYIVQYRQLLLWFTIKKSVYYSSYTGFVPEEHPSIADARRAIDVFCENQKYPRVAQNLKLRCEDE